MFALKQISNLINAEIIGEPNKIIKNIASIENCTSESIIFADSRKIKAIKRKFGAVILERKFEKLFPESNVLVVEDARLAFAKVTQFFKKDKSELKPLKSSDYKKFSCGMNCFVGEKFIIGGDCSFGFNIVIEDNVTIGNNVTIYSSTVIGNNVTIDSGSVIGANGFGNVFHNGKWENIIHLGNVEILDNVMVGANCCIDKATLDSTIINQGVIIDNLVHIAHNVIIGENTAIAAKVGIAGSCVIGKRNMIGGMVGIIDHIKTVDDVTISATSTVTKDLNQPGVFTGIMPISKHAIWKRIALWILKLDKIAIVCKFRKKLNNDPNEH